MNTDSGAVVMTLNEAIVVVAELIAAREYEAAAMLRVIVDACIENGDGPATRIAFHPDKGVGIIAQEAPA